MRLVTCERVKGKDSLFHFYPLEHGRYWNDKNDPEWLLNSKKTLSPLASFPMTTSLDFPFILWTSSRGRGRTGRWRHSRSLSSLAFPTPHRAIATYTALHFVAKPDRWASSPALYSGDVINHSELTELHDESDFEKLASSNDDLLSICGFGSLLSGMYDHHPC